MAVRTVIERGPKNRKSVAFSIDWPGWSRGAKSAELALETLESYRERYRRIADLAGMSREFEAAGSLEVVEDRVGTGSVDFWGISYSPSSAEQDPMSELELERGMALLRACWAFFDEAAHTFGADVIVSGDRHLPDLGAWSGIEIISPAELIARWTACSSSRTSC